VGGDTQAPKIVVPAKDKTLQLGRDGVVKFALGPFAEDVTGEVVFTTGAKARAAAARRLGGATFSARAGRPVVVRLRLSRSTRALVTRRHKLAVTAAITVRDAAGNAAHSTYRLVLRPRRRR
jgi:hypothetical protein